jgi:hypothetical protein
MTDFDADETVAPLKKATRKRFWTSDRIIGYSGAALALSAAFFPWYVFFNEDKFGINIATSTLSRILPDWAGRPVVNASPSAIPNKKDIASLPRPEEQLITGTVPDEESKVESNAAAAASQPFPAQSQKFRLLHIAKGKALIEDETGVYIVKPGSLLPDLSKVASLEERDGDWVIVTDKGDIYDANGKRQ